MVISFAELFRCPRGARGGSASWVLFECDAQHGASYSYHPAIAPYLHPCRQSYRILLSPLTYILVGKKRAAPHFSEEQLK